MPVFYRVWNLRSPVNVKGFPWLSIDIQIVHQGTCGCLDQWNHLLDHTRLVMTNRFFTLVILFFIHSCSFYTAPLLMSVADWTGANPPPKNYQVQRPYMKSAKVRVLINITNVLHFICTFFFFIPLKSSSIQILNLTLTSFILAALNDGVSILRTLFHCSFFNISRQSLMGLLAKRLVWNQGENISWTTFNWLSFQWHQELAYKVHPLTWRYILFLTMTFGTQFEPMVVKNLHE